MEHEELLFDGVRLEKTLKNMLYGCSHFHPPSIHIMHAASAHIYDVQYTSTTSNSLYLAYIQTWTTNLYLNRSLTLIYNVFIIPEGNKHCRTCMCIKIVTHPQVMGHTVDRYKNRQVHR